MMELRPIQTGMVAHITFQIGQFCDAIKTGRKERRERKREKERERGKDKARKSEKGGERERERVRKERERDKKRKKKERERKKTHDCAAALPLFGGGESACPSYRRQGGARPGVGVANMYSYSRATTPQCSLSRSGTSSDSNCHSLSSVRGVATHYHSGPSQPLRTPSNGDQSPFLPQFAHFGAAGGRPSALHSARSDCGSLISSQSSSATHSDNVYRDPSQANGRLPSYISSIPVSPADEISTLSDLPPPYSCNPPPSSTLVAVRTSGVPGSGSVSVRQQLPNANVNNRLSTDARRTGDVFIVGTGEHGCTSGMLTTFTQAPTAVCTNTPASCSTRLSSTDLHRTALGLSHPNFSLSNSTVGNLNNNPYSSKDLTNNRFQLLTTQRNDNENTALPLMSDQNTTRYPQSNAAQYDVNVISPNSCLENDDSMSHQLDDSDSGRASNSVNSMSPYNGNSSSSASSQYGNQIPYHNNVTSPHHGNTVSTANSDPDALESPCNSSNIINSIKKRPPMGVMVGSFSPALKPVTRPCSTAHIINTVHSNDDLPSATSDLPPKMLNMNMTKF
ncbi:hypothetical protein FHG87_015319 [Trinorchestia longiramus]|nr:hypothetical protein FHG87_015319 [Trinorchestia longiramus]